ncbi:MAG: hypothetical protein LWW85_12325 [Marinilabiliales bacterium]|nr:hypothetical protein [Marinilabiliales bacterium]
MKKLFHLISVNILFVFLIFSSCRKEQVQIMTVTGPVLAKDMGITLPREHILMDSAPLDSQHVNRYVRDSVILRMKPFLEELKQYKVKTFVDCTPEFMGRDPELLAELSRQTGLNILTGTGWFATDNGIHLPKEIGEMAAEDIAQLWINEAKHGIGNTGIKPGFINIGMGNAVLSDIDKKLIAAACLTHLETGLTIVSITGSANTALAQLAVLKQYGVDPSAFVWGHAFGESTINKIMHISKMGTWIAYDEIQSDVVTGSRLVNPTALLRATRDIDHILLSQHAGWYHPGQPKGGNIHTFSDIFTSSVLLLMGEGFSAKEIDQILVKNPAQAFAISVRKIKK